MPELICIKPHRYAGKAREVGRTYEASAKDAKVLVTIGKANYFTRDQVAEPLKTPAEPKNCQKIIAKKQSQSAKS